MDASGLSKGFGFVHFENAESADNAIKTVNDKILGTKRVYVGKFVTKKDRLRQKELVWTNVYVKDIDPAITDKELQEKFASFGPVTSCVIASNENVAPNNETPSRFGFVNFENHEDAVKAVAALHGSEMGSKKIWCGRAQKKAEREQELKKKFAKIRLERLTKFQGINLYIKNLEEDITEERLQNEFAAFGAIRSCKIMFDENGVNKGFGFVCYTTPDEAQRAINEMNNRPLSGFNKPLYVALHEPAEVRKQKLAQRHAARAKGVRGDAAPLYYANGNVPSGYVYRAQPRVWQYAAQPNYPVPLPNSQRGNGSRAGRGNNRGRNARHVQNQGPVPLPQDIGPMQGLQPPVAVPELTLHVLSGYPFETQKLLLGERLYPLIHAIQPLLAGKITGMLLDSGWGADELLSLINDENKLKTKVDEAIGVLRNHQPAEVHPALAPPQAVEQEVAN
jgi:polyadenylate-binding protein